MNISGYNNEDDPVDIYIYGVTINGLCRLVNCQIDTDSEPNDILTPCRYKSGTLSIFTDDNEVYSTDWYGKLIEIHCNDNLVLKGRISAQLTNAPYDCQREVIELQFVDTLTWIKSQVYDGATYTKIRDILVYFADKIAVDSIDVELPYNIVYAGDLSPLDMYVNVGNLNSDIDTLTCGEVIEGICRLLCVTAYVNKDILCLDYVCSKATAVSCEYWNNETWSTKTYKRVNYNIHPYESGTTVSYIDPKQSVTIECKYDEYELSEEKVIYQPTEYNKFSYFFQYSGTKKDYKYVSLLQAFGTKINMEYFQYITVDNANYNANATTPEVTYNTTITEDNISTYCTHSTILPKYINSACGYNTGAIHTKCCSQQLESIDEEPTGDESFSEGLLLYGLRGLTNRSQLTPTLLYPMYKKTIEINAVFSHSKALIYSINMQWNKYREEFFKTDYTGTAISGINFIYPRLAFRIKSNVGYLSVQDTGDVISNYRYANSGVTLDNTWSIIKPKNPTYPTNWSDDMTMAFDDFWSVTVNYGNSIILPDSTYIEYIEIVLLWAEQPRFMVGSTTLESYVASNLYVEEQWKLESKGVNINATDTVFIWENDSVNINGDVSKYTADFPSYDNKGDVTNALTIRQNNDTILVDNLCTCEFGNGLFAEEVRLKHYERQYSTPTFSEDVVLHDKPNEAGLFIEPITNKTMRVIGYSYDLITNTSNTKLIEIK